ncbi:hypothetical protein LPJ61_001692 [Coemansia biformis]|uniref:EamA domain-containing protein n=1 Tax=Coemansia biformis TaxID=1286918 RepID=A0A9W8CXV4_9FUNG|nr:hypothetical protein LPJ61_001692 [Coemansia biformis]
MTEANRARLHSGCAPATLATRASRTQQGRPSARRALLLGGISLLVCIVAFVGQTTVTRQVQESYVQPYFILWVAHSCWVVMLPLHAAFEQLKRNPRSLAALRTEVLVASATLIVQLRRRRRRRQAASSPPLPLDLPSAGEYQPVETADVDAPAGRRSGGIELASGIGLASGMAHARSAAKASTEAEDGSPGHADDGDDCGGVGSGSGSSNGGGDSCSDEAWALAHARPWWVLWRTTMLAAALVVLLNASAYLWYVAVGLTSMSKVTATNNTACFFAYLFSVLLLNDRVQAVKCVAVAASIVGVVLMALVGPVPDGQDAVSAATQRRSELLGDVLSLVCACGIGLYQVLYKKYAVPRGFHSLFAVNFFTALLGLCTLVLCWVPLPILHVAGVERFHWPSRAQLALVALNALLGIAYNGCFMIALVVMSPLFASIGIMLTIPVVAVVDMATQGRALAWNVLAGGAAILAGFCALTYAEYRDTVRKHAHLHSASGEDDSDGDDGGSGNGGGNSAGRRA